jgi:hypothetical protein
VTPAPDPVTASTGQRRSVGFTLSCREEMPMNEKIVTVLMWTLCTLPTASRTFARAPDAAEPMPSNDADAHAEGADGGVEAAAESKSAGNQALATVVVRSEHPRDERITAEADPAASERVLHGFRLGYMVWFNHDDPSSEEDLDDTPAASLDLRSPHLFVIGYEVAWRLPAGSDALNVLLVGNVMAAGLEQSKFLPTANGLLGFEIDRSFQLGVGANVAPIASEDKALHMIVAAGWTPRSGDLYLPVHAFLIPDVDGHHRAGLTLGVTWAR